MHRCSREAKTLSNIPSERTVLDVGSGCEERQLAVGDDVVERTFHRN